MSIPVPKRSASSLFDFSSLPKEWSKIDAFTRCKIAISYIYSSNFYSKFLLAASIKRSDFESLRYLHKYFTIIGNRPDKIFTHSFIWSSDSSSDFWAQKTIDFINYLKANYILSEEDSAYYNSLIHTLSSNPRNPL